MDIHQLEIGKEYRLSRPYGKSDQKVVILNVSEKESSKWGKYWEADIEYTSDDCTKGMRSGFNKIECERYIHEL